LHALNNSRNGFPIINVGMFDDQLFCLKFIFVEFCFDLAFKNSFDYFVELKHHLVKLGQNLG